MFYMPNLISEAFVSFVEMCIFPAGKVIPLHDLGTQTHQNSGKVSWNLQGRSLLWCKIRFITVTFVLD